MLMHESFASIYIVEQAIISLWCIFHPITRDVVGQKKGGEVNHVQMVQPPF